MLQEYCIKNGFLLQPYFLFPLKVQLFSSTSDRSTISEDTIDDSSAFRFCHQENKNAFWLPLGRQLRWILLVIPCQLSDIETTLPLYFMHLLCMSLSQISKAIFSCNFLDELTNDFSGRKINTNCCCSISSHHASFRISNRSSFTNIHQIVPFLLTIRQGLFLKRQSVFKTVCNIVQHYVTSSYIKHKKNDLVFKPSSPCECTHLGLA